MQEFNNQIYEKLLKKGYWLYISYPEAYDPVADCTNFKVVPFNDKEEAHRYLDLLKLEGKEHVSMFDPANKPDNENQTCRACSYQIEEIYLIQ